VESPDEARRVLTGVIRVDDSRRRS